MEEKQSSKIPAELFHYCPLNSFFGIITSKNLRLCCSKYSNDPSENKIAKSVLTDIYKTSIDSAVKKFLDGVMVKLKQIDEVFFHTPYIFCMSEKSEDLNQWRIYSDNCRGFMIGLYTDYFKAKSVFYSTDVFTLNTTFEQLYIDRCIYDYGEQKKIIQSLISESLEILNQLSINQQILQFLACFKLVSAFFKDISYKEEKEWRLVCYPFDQQSYNNFNFKMNYFNKRSVIIPFIEFPFTSTNNNKLFNKIFIGSNVINNQSEIFNFIMNNKLYFSKVSTSKIKTQEIA